MRIQIRTLTTIAVALILAVGTSCTRSLDQVNGAPAAAPSPNVPWKAPAGAIKAEAPATTSPTAAVPSDLAARIQKLTLMDVVDLALRNNPATRAS